MDKIAIPCNCGCSVLLVMEFEELGEHPQEFIAEFFTSMDPKVSRLNRWQTAWRIFRGKDPWLHDVALDTKTMTELHDFLHKKLVDSQLPVSAPESKIGKVPPAEHFM